MFHFVLINNIFAMQYFYVFNVLYINMKKLWN